MIEGNEFLYLRAVEFETYCFLPNRKAMIFFYEFDIRYRKMNVRIGKVVLFKLLDFSFQTRRNQPKKVQKREKM